VCRLDPEGAEGADVVVDMHGVAIPNFFLLNILQVTYKSKYSLMKASGG